MNNKRKEVGCMLTVRYVPLPPAKRQQYEHTFDLLAELLLAELENDEHGIVERGPALDEIIAQPALAG
jgi:hypothetical protein